MSQHDLDIANQGFPATRADLNLALKALGSLQSGATAPSTTYANMLWYDTANNILKIRNEDNDAFISLFTLDQTADNIEALTINGTMTADVLAVNSAASITANLPTFTITGQGRANGFEIAGTTGNTTLTEKSNNGIQFGTNNTNRMTITSGGGVGIGTTSPTKKLSASIGLNDTDGLALEYNGENRGGILLNPVGGEVRMGAQNSTGTYFTTLYSNGSERVRVDQSGNVGIGCTNGDITSDGNASRKYVTIQGTGNRGRLNLGSTATSGADVGTLGFTNGTNTVAAISVDSDAGSQTNGLMAFATSGSTRMTIDSGGNVLATSGTIGGLGSYNNTTGSGANVHILSSGVLVRSTSSSRYKNTINDATHGLTELLTLRPVTYKGNNDGDTVFGGLIAEEVHDAGLTEFVQYNDDNEPDSLAYGNMVSLCIKAIQEQQATITALEARIAALEGA
jgi:hypothetical protein